MTLTITIEMDNAAFGDDAESRLAEVQRIIARKIGKVSLDPGEYGRFMDTNGNTVGKWEVSE